MDAVDVFTIGWWTVVIFGLLFVSFISWLGKK